MGSRPIMQPNFSKAPEISQEMNFSIFSSICKTNRFYFPIYLYCNICTEDVTACYERYSHATRLHLITSFFVFYTLYSYLCIYYSIDAWKIKSISVK